MANFFTDNDDILFRFKTIDLGQLAEIREGGFRFAREFDYAPADAAEAVENYRLTLTSLGQLAAEFIAPRAEDVDAIGPVLQEDGLVAYAVGTAESLAMLAKAEVMGFTLPHRFGGLNFPSLVYTMAIEVVSRADAALMNIFGLQGMAETINAFASEEIKQEYLPDMAAGKTTGAMVLTEPEAGSDLQSVKLRAFQDESGQWRLNGVKRFITNGCGEILLVLARSEPETTDGLGLSLFLAERNEAVKVRRLERKLGIHGSPTCELQFNDCPAKLIGERQRGLITYVMSLMNGARIGIAAQSLGIGEAAFRVARNYAAKRRQFDQAIENFPAVRDLLIDARLELLAARALHLRDQSVGRCPLRGLAQAGVRPSHRQGTAQGRPRYRAEVQAAGWHAHSDEQILCQRDGDESEQRRHRGARRQRLHERLPGRALHARRPNHHHL